jgi:hypothetical protein
MRRFPALAAIYNLGTAGLLFNPPVCGTLESWSIE